MKSLLIISLFVAGTVWAKAPRDEVYQAMDDGQFSQADYEALVRGADEDYFSAMDKGITLPAGTKRADGSLFEENQDNLVERLQPYLPEMSREELVERVVKGRNNWLVYTGGNDRFWDHFNKFAFGGIDFLKTLSNHPDASVGRSKRWQKLGLINEPCFKESRKPRADRFGLWLDVRDPACPPDPFENTEKYPGVKIGARGESNYVGIKGIPRNYTRGRNWINAQAKKQGVSKKTKLEVGSSYGYASGIVGLRLFPNPDFDYLAAAKWDPKRYYEDPNYYNNPNLVKPYRVAMACAFCHVGTSPTNPPSDFNNPKWENLSSTVGTQYFWVDRIFYWDYKRQEENFVHQLLHTARPGTLDTSLISSDQINNPRTMNAIYDLRARVKVAFDLGHNERIEGPQSLNKQFSELGFLGDNSPLGQFVFQRREKKKNRRNKTVMARVNYVTSPRVLKDGSDSVGALGALNRVYVNIGLYSEEWLRNFVPLLGTFDVPFFRISPFQIREAEKNSGYWNANTEQTPDLALFMLAAGSKDHLQDAPRGRNYVKPYDSTVVERGKEVFADNCASCHSSKFPKSVANLVNHNACIGGGYLDCWDKYWNHVNTSDRYKTEMREIVKAPDFLEDNYMSTELRVPVDVVGSQVCNAVATNAIENDIWDNFSSASYKELPGIEQASVYEPSDDGSQYIERKQSLPAGGRGYLRPPSLISLWSTAPFLNNNTLGPFLYKGTTAARMQSFQKSMEWLLYPERRGKTVPYTKAEKIVSFDYNGHKAKGIVDVFSVDSYVSIPAAYIPRAVFQILPKKWKQTYPNYVEPKSNRTDLFQRRQNAKVRPSLLMRAWRSIASVFSSQESTRSPSSYDDGTSGAQADYEVVENEVKRIYIGPIPKGVPINLIANLNAESKKTDIVAAVLALVRGINAADKTKGEKARAQAFMREASGPLLKVSKCTDFIVNKGHYFGTQFQAAGKPGLSDQDKKALIEFVKHF